jgi:hypothetical protein
VESEDRWDRVKVLDEWPEPRGALSMALRGATYNKLYQYGAEVVYAAGAFNWRVAVGDRTRIIDYAQGESKLTAESSDAEIVWSISSRVAEADVRKWFAKPPSTRSLPDAAAESGAADGESLPTLKRASIVASIILAVINLPISLAYDDDEMLVPVIGLLALWIPFWVRNRFEHGGSKHSGLDSDGDD